MASETIWVEGAKGGEGQVALWDRDPEQKDGEVLVATGQGPVEVVETAAVALAIGEGRLKRVSQPKPEPAEAESPKQKTGGKARGGTIDTGDGATVGNAPPADANVGSGTEGDGT